ncbi:unnamed protein product [Lactuca saligna]|uniref:Uncharacterized protein n=1 Tax=Lactuca saligna TaxID=75948 RepID=A0AA36ECG2_LACSI|nr:unnamed protein product [Lactuca saligna]
MVSSVESCFLSELAPNLDLVLRLPNNAPLSANVSQGEERGIGSPKGTDEDKSIVVGKSMSTQIPTLLPMKTIVRTSTIITTPNANVDLSNLQKNGTSIREGGSSFVLD